MPLVWGTHPLHLFRVSGRVPRPPAGKRGTWRTAAVSPNVPRSLAGLRERARPYIRPSIDLFSGGRELVGMNAKRLPAWTFYCAKGVCQAHGADTDKHEFPETNTVKFMEKRLNISKTQASPQEQDIAAYNVGVMRRNDGRVVFDDVF